MIERTKTLPHSPYRSREHSKAIQTAYTKQTVEGFLEVAHDRLLKETLSRVSLRDEDSRRMGERVQSVFQGMEGVPIYVPQISCGETIRSSLICPVFTEQVRLCLVALEAVTETAALTPIELQTHLLLRLAYTRPCQHCTNAHAAKGLEWLKQFQTIAEDEQLFGLGPLSLTDAGKFFTQWIGFTEVFPTILQGTKDCGLTQSTLLLNEATARYAITKLKMFWKLVEFRDSERKRLDPTLRGLQAEPDVQRGSTEAGSPREQTRDGTGILNRQDSEPTPSGRSVVRERSETADPVLWKTQRNQNGTCRKDQFPPGAGPCVCEDIRTIMVLIPEEVCAAAADYFAVPLSEIKETEVFLVPAPRTSAVETLTPEDSVESRVGYYGNLQPCWYCQQVFPEEDGGGVISCYTLAVSLESHHLSTKQLVPIGALNRTPGIWQTDLLGDESIADITKKLYTFWDFVTALSTKNFFGSRDS